LFKKGVAKFRTNLIAPIILIGLSAFLIDVSYAVANIFYIPILANTAANIFDHANRNGMYFQTIEGAIMPALNLLFITVYGIADGERLIVAYNYSLGNWKRIKKTYQYTIFITFIYCTCAVLLVCVALGQPILQLFGIDKSTVMFQDAYNVVLIQSLMVVVFSLQVAAMSLFMSISDIVRSNIAAIFQDTIIFFPVLGVCYGITMATGNI
jgi:Na+-driven multidrug efflux pump